MSRSLHPSHECEVAVQIGTAHTQAAHAAIVDSNPGARHATSASTSAKTVACTNAAEVLDGVLGALDTHEFVFARSMGLADASGCGCVLPSTL
jgi:RNA exonuclease 1